MTHKSYASTGAQPVPTVNVTVNNNRLKRYNKQNYPSNYYLKNGQEFQLELFNPTNGIVKADISLNNVKIPGGGLVLKPGERVFLDRYLDSPRKFKFETYEVGNSKEVKKAIEKNGLVKVEFYQQDLYSGWNTTTSPYIYYNNYTIPSSPSVFYTTGNVGLGYSNTSHTLDVSGTVTMDSFISTNSMSGIDSLDIGTSKKELLCDSNTGKMSGKLRSNKIETGRVGEGSKSDQSFTYVDYKFLSFPYYTIEYQILPLSTKQTTTSDLNVKRYCTECGTKYSKGNKYCSNCGHKL